MQTTGPSPTKEFSNLTSSTYKTDQSPLTKQSVKMPKKPYKNGSNLNSKMKISNLLN